MTPLEAAAQEIYALSVFKEMTLADAESLASAAFRAAAENVGEKEVEAAWIAYRFTHVRGPDKSMEVAIKAALLKMAEGEECKL